jgi:hypothetical protein
MALGPKATRGAALLRFAQVGQALADKDADRADRLVETFMAELGADADWPPYRSRRSRRKRGRQLPLCVGVERNGEPCDRVRSVGAYCRWHADLYKEASRRCPECDRLPSGPKPGSRERKKARTSATHKG